MNFFCFWLVYGLYQWFISETGQLDSPIVVETVVRGESQGGEDAGDGDDAAHRGQRRGWIPRGVFQQTFSMGGCHEKWCCHGDFIIKNDDFHGISMDLWHQKW